MILPYFLLAGGIVFLWASAGALIGGTTSLGQKAGISSMVMGLTVVSIATSLPELAVSMFAALRGSPALAVGNVLGSNLANVGLILGFAATLRPIKLQTRVVRREVPWMLGITVIALPLFWNLELGRVEGTILMALLLAYLVSLVRSSGSAPRVTTEEELQEIVAKATRSPVEPELSYLHSSLLILAGMLGLVLSGNAIVEGATQVAAQLGIREMIVGLSIVAVGTSLPELATTVVAALRDEDDLAVGNVVGSNIFNLSFVLGGTALIRPIEVEAATLRIEYPAVLVMSLLIVPLAWRRPTLGRVQGVFFLALYGAAWWWILSSRGGL